MRMSMMFSCILFVMGVMASCSSVSLDKVPGVYAMHSPYGIELLRLEADGRYTQVVLLNTDSTAITHTGEWRYPDDSTTVLLADALMVIGLDGKLRSDMAIPVEGYLETGIISRFGESVWLMSDENYVWKVYKKIEHDYDPGG